VCHSAIGIKQGQFGLFWENLKPLAAIVTILYGGRFGINPLNLNVNFIK